MKTYDERIKGFTKQTKEMLFSLYKQGYKDGHADGLKEGFEQGASVKPESPIECGDVIKRTDELEDPTTLEYYVTYLYEGGKKADAICRDGTCYQHIPLEHYTKIRSVKALSLFVKNGGIKCE